MLMQDLGFHAPPPEEEARILAKRTTANFADTSVPGSIHLVAAAVLSGDPLISYSGKVPRLPLGLASIDAVALRKRSAWFLISPTWSIEENGIAEELHELAVLHRRRNPHHRLIFVCNTPSETSAMQKLGEAALFYNKTANTSERIFRPLDDIRVEFDAIYNAQLVPWKRHELSLEIANCAFLFYLDRSRPGFAEASAAIVTRHASVPGHAFLNRFDENNVPIRFPLSEVNRQLNRASVGLCLSEREGAMFASTEYLLSGLPIVTTPSAGGRHVYHDEEYCWTVPPNSRSVADAVYALKAKAIPRAYIRDRTLRRLEPDRERFLTLINAILEESGSQKRLGNPWPFRRGVTMQWMPPGEAVDRAVYGFVDGFDIETVGFLLWRAWRKSLRLKRQWVGGRTSL
jgi:hypothetical protein